MSRVESFSYKSPPDEGGRKVVVRLGATDVVHAHVQVVSHGGENNLHSHPKTDGIWFVLAGRCRFYGENDIVLGEFGVHEGITIGRGTKYWFESVGEDRLEILHIAATSRPGVDLAADRINHTPLTAGVSNVILIDEGGASRHALASNSRGNQVGDTSDEA